MTSTPMTKRTAKVTRPLTSLETRIYRGLSERLTVRQMSDVILGRHDHGLTVREHAIVQRVHADLIAR